MLKATLQPLGIEEFRTCIGIAQNEDEKDV